jgi:hypothetical protein
MLEYSIRPPVVAQEVGSFGLWESSFRGDFICLPYVSPRLTSFGVDLRALGMIPLYARYIIFKNGRIS